MATKLEINTNVQKRARTTGLDDMVDDFINNSIDELQDPGWAFAPRRLHHHLWSFNKRKTTFSTVANQEDYQLPRDLDEIGLLRQTDSPYKLRQLPDEIFYRMYPNPTATGNPFLYRVWEETGVATDLSTDDKVSVVSDNTADTTQKVSVVGYRSSDGMRDSEEISLNGTTTVDGTITWKSGRPLRISKSADTTGKISIYEVTTDTNLLVELGPEERATRFKELSLYPIPGSAITMYLEYFTRLRHVHQDTDAPDLPEKWHWVIEQGTLAKLYEYKQDKEMIASTYSIYLNAVRNMIISDNVVYDYIPYLRSTMSWRRRYDRYKLGDEAASGYYGTPYGLWPW